MWYLKRIACFFIGHKLLARPSTIRVYPKLGLWTAICYCDRCGKKDVIMSQYTPTVKP